MPESGKKTKASNVLEALYADISSGFFAPGDKLQMENLKERYGVGYSPLREALSRLTANGLVLSQDQRGFCVAALSIDELRDIYFMRFKLESLGLELSLQYGDDAWEGEILAAYHCYSKYLDPNNKQPFVQADWERIQHDFIFNLIKACRSPWLLKMHDLLYTQTSRYRSLAIHTSNKEVREVLSNCLGKRKLIDAILARDKETVMALLHTSYLQTIEFMEALFTQYKENAA